MFLMAVPFYMDCNFELFLPWALKFKIVSTTFYKCVVFVLKLELYEIDFFYNIYVYTPSNHSKS